MGRWTIFIIERGVVIGIKSRLIEFSRHSRCNYGDAGIRDNEPVSAGSPDFEGGRCGTVRPSNQPVGTPARGGDWGSAAIGISECSMLGFEPEDARCCRFSRSVSAGFSARIERIRKRGTKIA